MKKLLVRGLLAAKAARELGFAQTFWYALYQVGLRTGHYRRATPLAAYEDWPGTIRPLFQCPERAVLANIIGEHAQDVIDAADEICTGQVRLFGGPPVPLNLQPPGPRQHWTAMEGDLTAWGVEDIKFVWEPARFGWAYTLGRAYVLAGEEKYAAAFWQYFEAFLTANPPNVGPNWSSGQEVALRMLALLFARTAFEHSPESTPQRMAKLAGAVAAHARRIPPTLVYARAQNNNHLVSEALGLYAAGSVLEGHSSARRWCETGRKMLNHALRLQIEPDGTYAQHSMNYHRLMLQAALQAGLVGQAFTAPVRERLAAATRWLLAQVDPSSGYTPNLGSNDGALILPLAAAEFRDYRPTAQAAARAFLGEPAFPPGPWDELGLWLGQAVGPPHTVYPRKTVPESPAVLRLGDAESWGTIRAVHFKGRPAHADQLHVDLWWRGENIALDAGTFRYTAPAPWDNALSHTSLHNTVEVNGQDQMRRAGRFLWLDWAQAEVVKTDGLPALTIAGRHNGYTRLGVMHQRTLKWEAPSRWLVTDQILPVPSRRLDVTPGAVCTARLHWLLPDWPWSLDGSTITLTHPSGGRFSLSLSATVSQHAQAEPLLLVRAGEVLAGQGKAKPVQGWFSPTYNVKLSALSFSLTVKGPLPLQLFSEWVLNI